MGEDLKEPLQPSQNWNQQGPDHAQDIEQDTIQNCSPKDPIERDRFNSHLEYLLSVLGFAAGFGSVWRFPYLIYKNGGGVFLIPYFIIVFLVGIPSFYFETAIGQMLQRSPPQCFQMSHKKWKGFGIFSIMLSLDMSTYYNLLLAYSFYYLWESFKSPLPWQIDDIRTSQEPWNTDYFYKDVLHSSSGLHEIGNIVWPLFFCFILSQIVVYLCIQKGVAVSGKVSLVTATSPFILLFILMVRGLFLDGAMNGLKYLFSPDWSKLFSPQVWVEAANQVIFQVSSGVGVLILLGSYRPKNQEIIKSSYYIPLLTVMCGLLASIVIFTYMGFMSNLTHIPIDQMPLKGPDLSFIVFPAVLAQMPFSNLLSIIFFIIMVFLGIDTQFAQVDALAGTLEDEYYGVGIKLGSYTIPPKWIRATVCFVIAFSAFIFCTQAGFYYLDFVDNYSVSINMFICLFMECYFYFFIESWETIENKIKANIGVPTPAYMIFLMKYSVPFCGLVLGLLAIYLQILDIANQKWWVLIFGWSLTLYPYFYIYYYYQKYKNESNTASIERQSLNLKQIEMNEF